MVQNVQMVPCRVLVGDKRYCAYVLIYDKFEPFERFEPLLGPFERFERYISTSLYCTTKKQAGRKIMDLYAPIKVLASLPF